MNECVSEFISDPWISIWMSVDMQRNCYETLLLLGNICGYRIQWCDMQRCASHSEQESLYTAIHADWFKYTFGIRIYLNTKPEILKLQC